MKNAIELAAELRPYVEGKRNRLFSEVEKLLGEILEFLENPVHNEDQLTLDLEDNPFDPVYQRHERAWAAVIDRLDKAFQLTED